MSGLPWTSVMYTTLELAQWVSQWLAHVKASSVCVPARFSHIDRLAHNKQEYETCIALMYRDSGSVTCDSLYPIGRTCQCELWTHFAAFSTFTSKRHNDMSADRRVYKHQSILDFLFVHAICWHQYLYRSDHLRVGTVSWGSQSLHQTTTGHYCFSNPMRYLLHTCHLRLARLHRQISQRRRVLYVTFIICSAFIVLCSITLPAP